MVTCPGPSGNRNRRSPAHSPPNGATEHGRPAVHAAATDSRPSPGVGWYGRSGPNCLSGRLYRLRGRSRPRPRRRVPSVEPGPPSPASADDPSVTAPPGIATVDAQSPPCLTPIGAGCLPRRTGHPARRATVMLEGQRCREVEARGERSWPSVGSPPKAAHGANLFRKSALTVATASRRPLARQVMALSVDTIRASTPGQQASGPASSTSSPAVPP
jgi:hypothetical protein